MQAFFRPRIFTVTGVRLHDAGMTKPPVIDIDMDAFWRDPYPALDHLRRQIPAPQDGLDSRQHFGEVEGLGDIILDAQFETFYLVFHVVHGGKHDDGDGGILNPCWMEG